MNNLMLTRLRELLAYDPETGKFTWVVARSRQKCGAIAGSTYGDGYLGIRIDGVNYLAHRLAWLYHHGVWPTHVIDHINGCKTDNRIVNLRDVPQSVNRQCQRKASTRSTTGLIGVCNTKTSFHARVMVNGETHHIGAYKTADEAHAAYLKARAKLTSGEQL